MYKNKKVVGLIPARGGSKGLPRKNIRLLSGKPLIAWTIEEAKKSRYIDSVIVSTEDAEIAEISRRYGAEVPFLRPGELATDASRGIDVVIHAIGWLEKAGKVYDILILLQPTSPLRTAEDIDAAIRLIFERNASAIVSVCEAEHHPYHSKTLPADGCMKNFMKRDVLNKNRQELPVFYRLNGALYVGYCDYLKRQKSFQGDKTFAYIMPKGKSVDIDSEVDLKLAETLLKYEK